MQSEIFIGTAGWSIPSQLRNAFPPAGSHLARYSRVLNAVEINSSFYREHKAETYARWSAEVPEGFRFSVKLSRYFTQEKRLTETGAKLTEVLSGISALGDKWSVLLVQLPPSLGFDARVARSFFSGLRARYEGAVALEPRHLSWASPEAVELMQELGLSRVVADPERCPVPESLDPGARSLLYLRLHGSPEIYKSRYPQNTLDSAAAALRLAPGEAWCIFDNTTFGYATENALELSAGFQALQATA